LGVDRPLVGVVVPGRDEPVGGRRARGFARGIRIFPTDREQSVTRPGEQLRDLAVCGEAFPKRGHLLGAGSVGADLYFNRRGSHRAGGSGLRGGLLRCLAGGHEEEAPFAPSAAGRPRSDGVIIGERRGGALQRALVEAGVTFNVPGVPCAETSARNARSLRLCRRLAFSTGKTSVTPYASWPRARSIRSLRWWSSPEG